MTRGTVTAAAVDQDVYTTISSTITKVMALLDWDAERFRLAMGLTRSAYYNRAAGDTRWSAAEVKRAADILGVSVQTLYEGLDLSLVLPHLDSNQKPADYQRGMGPIITHADWEIAA
jgi:hypothetical protein